MLYSFKLKNEENLTGYKFKSKQNKWIMIEWTVDTHNDISVKSSCQSFVCSKLDWTCCRKVEKINIYCLPYLFLLQGLDPKMTTVKIWLFREWLHQMMCFAQCQADCRFSVQRQSIKSQWRKFSAGYPLLNASTHPYLAAFSDGRVFF